MVDFIKLKFVTKQLVELGLEFIQLCGDIGNIGGMFGIKGFNCCFQCKIRV